MQAMNSWRQRIASVLEWSATDKGMIPVVMLILTYSQYLLWGQYTLHRPDRDQLINVPVMQELTTLVLILTAGSILLFGTGLLLRRQRPNSLRFQLLTTVYFALTLSVCSHYIGTLTLSAGVVLLGGPVFGFIVLNRAVVWTAFIVALTTIVGLSYASSAGLLPYAPVVIPPATAAAQLFWTSSNFLFAAPHVILIVILADQTLNWWRKREDMIRHLSRTDALTGIHNRRSIIEMMEKESARTHRHGPPLCVVLLDLDHFKKINDTWGHPMGDRVLQETAALLRDTIRQCDAVGRYGGEEFMLILPDTSLEGAGKLVERCRANLANLNITSPSGARLPISGSFGLVCNQYHLTATADLLIKEADDALYQAKDGGRNRVVAVNLYKAEESVTANS